MKISDLSERSRLQLRLEEQPDDVDARRALARLLLQTGDTRRAAQELMSVATVYMARGDGDETLRAARFALGLDPENIELRLLMVQAHARFPSAEHARAAEPQVAPPAADEAAAAEPARNANFRSGAARREQAPPPAPTMKVSPVPDRVPRRRTAPKHAPADQQPSRGGTESSRTERPADEPSLALRQASETVEREGALSEATSSTAASAKASSEAVTISESSVSRTRDGLPRERGQSSADTPAGSAPSAVDSLVLGASASASVDRAPTGVSTDVTASELDPSAADPVELLSPEDLQMEFSPPTVPARPVESLIRPGREGERTADGGFHAGIPAGKAPRINVPSTSSGVASRVAVETLEGVVAVTVARRILGKDHGLTLADVPANPLFERLPRGARGTVFEACDVVRYAPGAEMVREDASVDRLIVICEGTVLAGPDEVLEAGRLLGEYEFLAGMPARGRAVAGSTVTTLELSRQQADTFRSSDPQINDAFVASLRDRVLHDLMSRAPLFASLSVEQRRDLSARFFSLAVGPGETVMQTGDINRRLFVLQSGELVLDGRGGAGGLGRVTLQAGDFFGYVSTVLGRPVQVGVVSSSSAVLLVLPEQEVYRLVAGNKGVARAARREVVERGELPVSIEAVSGLGGLRSRRPTA